ncbi:MAG: amidohydrolase family protein [Acidimicrobiia bacterium]
MERRLITSDCHIAPPYSLLDELPESYRVHFPRLERRDGVTRMFRPMPPAMAMMGGGGGVEVDDTPRALARAAVSNVCAEAEPSFDPAEQLADLERYPDLHVIMTEGYAAWLAFAMQFFDHHWSDSRFGVMTNLAGGPMAATLEAPPSFYLKRQAHATFMWDPIAIRTRDLTGIDCLLWGNDYPHQEGSFPFSQEWIDKQFAGVPEHEIDAMVRGNAARLFGIDV